MPATNCRQHKTSKEETIYRLPRRPISQHREEDLVVINEAQPLGRVDRGNPRAFSALEPAPLVDLVDEAPPLIPVVPAAKLFD
jgi:hypothetical protein